MAISVERGRVWRPWSICRESMVLAAVCMVDLATTVALLVTGQAEEANPLMAFFLQHGLVAFCLGKLLFVVPPLVAAEWYRRYNDGFVRALLRGVTVAYVALYVIGTLIANGVAL